MARLAYAFFGYLAAVLVAVTVTVFAMLAPTIFPDDGAWGSYYAYRRDLGDVFQLGLVFTFPTALPGFVLTLFVARRGRWMGWLPFASAGALTALLALEIVALWMRASLFEMPPGMLLSSLLGGFCGGCAYWAVVRWSLADRWGTASP